MSILSKFGSVFSLNFAFVLILVGLILLLWDRRVLLQKKRRLEHRLSIILGIVYLVLGVGSFIAGKVFGLS